MAASFAQLLFKVRNSFIVAGLVDDDINNNNDLPRQSSEPWISTQSLVDPSIADLFNRKDDKNGKGSDSDCAENDSADSTNESQNGNPDWGSSDCSDSMSSFDDIGMLREETPECWPDDMLWEQEAVTELACAPTPEELNTEKCVPTTEELNTEKQDIDEPCAVEPSSTVEKPNTDEPCTVEPCSKEEASTDSGSCAESSSGNRFEEEEAAPSSKASSFVKSSSEKSTRWADMFDDPGTEETGPERDQKRMPWAKTSSPRDAEDESVETKPKRTNRRKSLIDKAVSEQQYPQRRSKLRSTAPVFVPMACLEVSTDGKKLCKNCGATGEQNFKFCNYCGNPYPVVPPGTQ